ncbi:MAG: hypothetical protein RR140_00435 [Clostridia bacterium]
MLTCLEKEEEIIKKHDDQILFIILLCKDSQFENNLKPFNIQILGKKMWEWILPVAGNYEVKTTSYSSESNILQAIKPLLTSAKHTVVLFSSTPLITNQTVLNALEYVKAKDSNILVLPKGYIFNTEYAKTADSITGTPTNLFGVYEFMEVSTPESLANAQNVLRKRILEFHQKQGVILDSPETTWIDAEVVIEKNVKICANNTIRGKTLICKNAILDVGNLITDSIILQGALIIMSSVQKSKISENMVVGPFEKIENQNV